MPGEGDLAAPSGSATEAREKPVKQFTWRELSKLNCRHNAHVAYRGKVRQQQCPLTFVNYCYECVCADYN